MTKTFGPKVAVSNLDLDIPSGRLIGLIGSNGAGKTTTIRMVMSILFPDTGTIEVLGRASAIESKDRIGYLPEERGLYKKMKVAPFLEFIARLKNADTTNLSRRVMEWLARVELQDVAKKKCEELSKGMQQKVQFIAAIIHEPDLLILDEPFSGLDPVNSRLLRDLIDEQHKRGCTVIFSTHQMSQAENLCDRVVMINQGQKVLDNTPEEISARFDPHAVYAEPDAPAGAAAGGMGAPGGVADPAVLDLARVLQGSLGDRVPDAESIEARGRGIVAHLRPGASAARLMTQLASAHPMRRLEIVRPTLEDVFISIVKGSDPATAIGTRLGSGSAGDASGD